MSLRAVLCGILITTGINSTAWAQDTDPTPSVMPVLPAPVTSSDTSETSPPSQPFVTAPNDGSTTAIILSEPVDANPVPPPPPRDLLADSAVRYGTFHSDVANSNRDFQSLTEINDVAKRLATHSPESISSGWLAYSALIAAESEEFAEEVRKMESYYGHDRAMQYLNDDMRWIMQFDGADDALGRAMKVSRSDSRRLERIGKSISQQSVSLQSVGWAKAKLGNNSRFLKELELVGVQDAAISGSIRNLFDVGNLDTVVSQADQLGASASLWDNISGGTTATVREIRLPGFSSGGFSSFQMFSSRDQQYDFMKARIATLAAYRILGETNMDSDELRKVLIEPESSSGGLAGCLRGERQQFDNCVYANYLAFERPVCIGDKQVSAAARCIERVAK